MDTSSAPLHSDTNALSIAKKILKVPKLSKFGDIAVEEHVGKYTSSLFLTLYGVFNIPFYAIGGCYVSVFDLGILEKWKPIDTDTCLCGIISDY